MSIALSTITKIYGEQKAVDEVSFSVKKGEIVGFLGPNGAGKSTTMKMLTGYVTPTSGSILVSDIDVLEKPILAQKKIGYLPEHNPLYLEMYVREYLRFHGRIQRVSKSSIEEVITKVGLAPEAHKKIQQLSKGYRQRVGLAAALLHDPEVLILDEPTTGLDPNQLVEMRQLIRELGKDKTVLLSTHIMQEVEAVCDRVIIINKGKVVANTSLKELKSNEQQIIRVTFDFRIEPQFLTKLPNLLSSKNTSENNWTLSFDTQEDMRPLIFDFAKDNGLKILGLSTENKSLENLFHELTK